MSKSNKSAARILEDLTQKPVEQPDGAQQTVDDKGRKTVVSMSMEELEKKGLKNKSQVIRYLSGDGYAPAAIARFLNIRYQHVRNVLNQPLKRPVAASAPEAAPAE